ncbi:MAG TPA: hypothetical protein PL110_13695 [Candidatus Eremiobacteraeota bacterium]|nr:MAG: hypothetical protein BWY64_00652 [bacterium ADurb.Bin363]HPZ09158.1 hypothetical protein [Candidatus Eremiobacteraeota bacterium]
MKVALKFKPKAFEREVRYETTGKITKKVNFPSHQTTEANFILIISIELVKIIQEGLMELSFRNEKASYIVSGDIKEVPLTSGIVRLSQDGEITLVEGEPVKAGIEGRLIFPQRFISIGDSWENPMRMELPFFPRPIDFIIRSSLEKFELYEDDKICAVINNVFYSPEENKVGKFQGKEINYFDYEIGRLIKSVLKMRIISNIFGITFDFYVNTDTV